SRPTATRTTRRSRIDNAASTLQTTFPDRSPSRRGFCNLRPRSSTRRFLHQNYLTASELDRSRRSTSSDHDSRAPAPVQTRQRQSSCRHRLCLQRSRSLWIPYHLSNPFQVVNSTDFVCSKRHKVRLQISKRLCDLFHPGALCLHARMAILTIIVFLLHAVDDQIAHGHALLPQQRAILFCLADTHRFRNRHEHKSCLLLVVK